MVIGEEHFDCSLLDIDSTNLLSADLTAPLFQIDTPFE